MSRRDSVFPLWREWTLRVTVVKFFAVRVYEQALGVVEPGEHAHEHHGGEEEGGVGEEGDDEDDVEDAVDGVEDLHEPHVLHVHHLADVERVFPHEVVRHARFCVQGRQVRAKVNNEGDLTQHSEAQDQPLKTTRVSDKPTQSSISGKQWTGC